MATPAEEIRACIADIQKADWVAIDLEFSGLFTEKPRSSHRSLSEYFSHCVESVTTFSCLQIGFCCSLGGRYTVHEFYCAPRQQFQIDLNSLRFLRRHKFDVNEFMDKCMLCDPVGKSRAGGITEVIEALIERKCALVFHHGLFDVLHIASAFLGDIEDMGLDDFLEFWKEKVPNPIFDTRYLAQEGKLTVLRHAGGLGLQDLHRSLTKNNGPKGEAHASGKDALMTAELFAAEMDRYMEHLRNKSKKRQREENTFFESPLADRFRNFIAVGAVEPGFVKLKD
eukprot:GEMP01055169.1.p1 GENE.GEMP01055169.1~~GEMP01055169.1.p1  ORF type:complete len:283 (+),score=50.52 GEMP01055169.1:138-986(+)